MLFRDLRFLAVLLVVALTCPVPRAGAQEAADSRLVKSLLADWQRHRERLLSGSVVVSVKERRGKVREDTVTTFSFGRARGVAKAFVAGPTGPVGAWLLRPEYFAQCPIDGSSHVSVSAPAGVKLGFVKDLDPRCFGMGLIRDFRAATPFQEIVARFDSLELQKVVKTPAGAYEVEWLHTTKLPNKFMSRLNVTIDPAKGFSCQKFVAHSKEERLPDWMVGSTAVTKWVEKNGVWVPESVSLRGLPTHEVEIRLDWKSVNRPVADSEFQIDAMGVPPGSKIVDARGARGPVVIGKVGERTTIPAEPRP